MQFLCENEVKDITIECHEKEYIVCNNNNYFKLGLMEGALLKEICNGSSSEVIQEKFNVSEEYIISFIRILREKNLIGEPKQKKNSIFFYRIPLFEADNIVASMADTVKRYKLLFGTLFVIFNIISLVGIADFISEAKDIFSFNNFRLPTMQYVILYVSLLIAIIMHEFAHGLSCKLFNGKVGKIGFMLILFTPAFYCDISGIRMIQSKWKRVMTSFAGIYLNIFLLSVATLIYTLTNISFFACFALMQFSLIVSNLLPFIKLDGYWILSFLTDITNLYDKARHNINLAWKGENLKERFIGIYGILTYCIMVIGTVSVAISLLGIITELLS